MAKGLLFIRTLTPTHPGAGTSTGAIDLMLQREVTTNFPFIQGSSIKGAVRSYLETQPVKDQKDLVKELVKQVKDYANTTGDEELKKELNKVGNPDGDIDIPIFKAREFIEILVKAQENDKEKERIRREFHPLYSVYDKVFGPYSPKGGLEKGALTITDASLLFYPVRSLKGLYAYITCPEILRRLTMPHIGILKEEQVPEIKDKSKAKAHSETKKAYEINGRLYFEDLNFDVESIEPNDLKWLDDFKLGEVKDRLFIVHNDVFQYFVEFATQITSRNKIDYDTGVVQTGALWSEEHLPPETYLFSYLEDNGRVVDDSQTAFKWLENKLSSSNVIHLGGDETVGKGFVKLRMKELKEGENGQN